MPCFAQSLDYVAVEVFVREQFHAAWPMAGDRINDIRTLSLRREFNRYQDRLLREARVLLGDPHNRLPGREPVKDVL